MIISYRGLSTILARNFKYYKALVRLGTASNNVNEPYEGLIDHVMIWNYPLTEEEVAAEMDSALNPPVEEEVTE
jgi:hypothetical protein